MKALWLACSEFLLNEGCLVAGYSTLLCGCVRSFFLKECCLIHLLPTIVVHEVGAFYRFCLHYKMLGQVRCKSRLKRRILDPSLFSKLSGWGSFPVLS